MKRWTDQENQAIQEAITQDLSLRRVRLLHALGHRTGVAIGKKLRYERRKRQAREAQPVQLPLTPAKPAKSGPSEYFKVSAKFYSHEGRSVFYMDNFWAHERLDVELLRVSLDKPQLMFLGRYAFNHEGASYIREPVAYKIVDGERVGVIARSKATAIPASHTVTKPISWKSLESGNYFHAVLIGPSLVEESVSESDPVSCADLREAMASLDSALVHLKLSMTPIKEIAAGDLVVPKGETTREVTNVGVSDPSDGPRQYAVVFKDDPQIRFVAEGKGFLKVTSREPSTRPFVRTRTL